MPHYLAGDPHAYCDSCFRPVVEGHVCEDEDVVFRRCWGSDVEATKEELRPFESVTLPAVRAPLPRLTARDFVEVGRFASYLRGEKAYSFTPRWWFDRLRRNVRWFFGGVRFVAATWLKGGDV